MKKYWILFKTHWQSLTTYRGDIVIYVLSTAILPLVALLVWRAASAGNNFAYSQRELTQYFLAVIAIKQLTFAWSAYFVGYDIQSGDFSKYLLKPLSVLELHLMNNVSEKIFKFVVLTFILMIISYWTLGSPIIVPGDPFILITLIISIALGLLLSLLISIILGLTVFWTNDLDFLRYFVSSIDAILSGLTIPLIFLPNWLQQLAFWLPFRYTLSFPAEIFLAKLTVPQIWIGLCIQLVWTVSMYLLYRLIYKQGIKVYQGFGG